MKKINPEYMLHIAGKREKTRKLTKQAINFLRDNLGYTSVKVSYENYNEKLDLLNVLIFFGQPPHLNFLVTDEDEVTTQNRDQLIRLLRPDGRDPKCSLYELNRSDLEEKLSKVKPRKLA